MGAALAILGQANLSDSVSKAINLGPGLSADGGIAGKHLALLPHGWPLLSLAKEGDQN